MNEKEEKVMLIRTPVKNDNQGESFG